MAPTVDPLPPSSRPLRVAVVGSGIAGLSAAWLLSRYPEFYAVTLYEADDYLGGHTHTVDVPPLKEFADQVPPAPVDTGFIVCNPVTYPNLLAFLDAVQVGVTPSDMSFSVSRNQGAFEWAGDTLKTLFAQRENVLDFSENGIWRMVLDVLRFHWHAAAIADLADKVTFGAAGVTEADRARYAYHARQSIGEFLSAGNYSPSFKHNFLVPQTAAIWSTPAGTCLDEFPILTLIRFFRNHRMLQLVGRPKWLTIPLGSRSYVAKVAEQIPDVRVGQRVTKITRGTLTNQPTSLEDFPRGQVTVTDDLDGASVYDYVILATHGDISLQLLADATPREREVLGKVRFSKNRAVLHRDPALMPKRRETWAAWNYLTKTTADGNEADGVCVTYWMNRLQPFIPRRTHGDVFVTVNPLYEPDPSLVIQEYLYDHPVYGFDLVQAQEQLASIANTRFTGFAGAWCNYGFHEDGVTAGLAAAAALGATPPFPVLLNGGYPTHRTLFHPVTGLPIVPSPAKYLAHLGAHLPRDAVAQLRRAAPAAPAVARQHTVDLTWAQTLAALGAAAATAWRGGVAAEVQDAPMVQGEPGATVPVRSVPARAMRGLTAQVRALELAERMLMVVLFACVGIPLLVLGKALGYVQVQDTVAEAAKGVVGGASEEKELVWVHPRVRIVWQKSGARNAQEEEAKNK
ncbi:hypothetical protein AMAG_02901 [Allomyces macrogynus ATCC 38327]|uniref:Amine oxidase domain-containing protein n=1 Tax=Allomyces macrogynus (strain ATCC 38327) TaxID=578462 RepID=A0A0L0S464_ALLM3|nr:hypothetical protein AMAG_02901 [Allomyces macrogynus ATCC 38327]|eukprot:KNE57154.1 hypothetical protein AMAG_02901 [Allomyces macrogynus ATCC 38327]